MLMKITGIHGVVDLLAFFVPIITIATEFRNNVIIITTAVV